MTAAQAMKAIKEALGMKRTSHADIVLHVEMGALLEASKRELPPFEERLFKVCDGVHQALSLGPDAPFEDMPWLVEQMSEACAEHYNRAEALGRRLDRVSRAGLVWVRSPDGGAVRCTCRVCDYHETLAGIRDGETWNCEDLIGLVNLGRALRHVGWLATETQRQEEWG